MTRIGNGASQILKVMESSALRITFYQAEEDCGCCPTQPRIIDSRRSLCNISLVSRLTFCKCRYGTT
ncbi:hypothetical protein MKW98_026141 [Papaver atlanticum]|uniref:Uncharacterized protein n=1 Tax=Papaver atlanticum TaxID=357466 RepID=A0AAD4RZI4_9MAGN|nr:hypothetical protein MKW98_026141 [Papaver atlanticum]